MFVTLVLVFVSGSFLLWRIVRTTLCDHYHMTHTAPRALSLQNYAEIPHMTAIHSWREQVWKKMSGPATTACCSLRGANQNNFVAI